MSDKMAERIESFVRDTEHKATSLYKRGYNEGKNDGYALGKQSGKEEMFEMLRTVANMPYEEFDAMFPGASFVDIITFYKADTIAEKLSERESKKSNLSVGDEVMDSNGIVGIITNTDTHYHIFYPHNGKTWKAPKTITLTKTGNRVDVVCRKERIEPWMPF